ncbi:8425_t:CDS:2 [Ambispora gerdemannii]|uniref:8425_t:CDS:1 n=1 Tax=Ambispora gerdemannii TaxID=144530 RepID=A0A9N8ZAZ7_9GLOM|nr:8425_t:CDS:2 [Ambispora gerdemannii]
MILSFFLLIFLAFVAFVQALTPNSGFCKDFNIRKKRLTKIAERQHFYYEYDDKAVPPPTVVIEKSLPTPTTPVKKFTVDHIFEIQIIKDYFKNLLDTNNADAIALCEKIDNSPKIGDFPELLDDLRNFMNDGINLRLLTIVINDDKGKIFEGSVRNVIPEHEEAIKSYFKYVREAFITTRDTAILWLCGVADGLNLKIDVGTSFSQKSRDFYGKLTGETLDDFACVDLSGSPEPVTIPVSFDVTISSTTDGVSTLNVEEVKNLTRFVTYSAAAYCSDVIADWKCGKYCNDIPGTNITKIISAAGLDTIFQTFGFISINKNNREIVITFRGSINYFNYLAVANVALVPYGTDPSIKVHGGFLASFNSLRKQMRDEITNLINVYHSYEIIVTGHSLGGNMAILAALDIKQLLNGTNPRLYTYGSLRPGNSNFASFVNNNLACLT